MTEKEIVQRINTELVEEFELDADAMTPEAHLYEDLGLDSLDAVDMVILLENALGCKLRNEEAIRSIRTLHDLHTFVIAKTAERNG